MQLHARLLVVEKLNVGVNVIIATSCANQLTVELHVPSVLGTWFQASIMVRRKHPLKLRNCRAPTECHHDKGEMNETRVNLHDKNGISQNRTATYCIYISANYIALTASRCLNRPFPEQWAFCCCFQNCLIRKKHSA